MTAPVENIYRIRLVLPDGRVTAISLLHGNSVLRNILDYLEENDIEAYLSLHKSEHVREDGNPFSISKTHEQKCSKKTISNDLHTNKQIAATKTYIVPETSKSVADNLTAGTDKLLLSISWNRGSVVITIWIVCLCSILKVGNAQSCMKSLTTLKSVPSCPVNYAEWNDAALRKRCLDVKQSCCSPKDFVYHCLINAFGNETVEVCAQRKRTYYCLEFNSLGALIQPNFHMQCTNSTIHCGKFYNSGDMYKVPQCFSVWKKHSETAEPSSLNSSLTTRAYFHPTSTSYVEIITKTPKISKNPGHAYSSGMHILYVILGVLGYALLTIAALKLATKYLKVSDHHKTDPEHPNTEDMKLMYLEPT